MADPYCIHIISDSTGETIASALRATIPMFGEVKVRYRRHVMIRSEKALEKVLDAVEADPGIVFHTVVETALRRQIDKRCHQIGVQAVPFLDPILSTLTGYFGQKAVLMRPGAQHEVDERYYQRVAALDFALSYDDGNLAERLAEADVVLIGVSRTSKTPTCVYMAGRGVKAANVPLILGKTPPPELFDLRDKGRLIVGLTVKPTRLAQIRENRLSALNHHGGADYADLEMIRREVIEARQLMEELECPMIDVTRRSIEETSAEILRMIEQGRAERIR